VWVLSLSLLFVFIAGYTVYQYDEFFSHMVGDVSDIQLLKSLRQIPTNKTVVVADADSWDEAWFQNPNIEYYTGRPDIQTYLIQDQGVPYADYMLARPEYTGQVVDFINGEGYGANVSATKEKCSTGLCLIHLIKSSK
jgi:hypothetical protein